VSNRLSTALSPYLLQHKNNPVNWYPWGEEAFKKASARNVPIFLSIGYAACHWCHVMAHESFEDPETAAFLNQHFVAIKVDREERPDIDNIYMDILVHTQGHGGWPLSLFLTHDAKPFFAGTYFPKEPGAGQMSFMAILQKITSLWQSDRTDVQAASQQLVQSLKASTAIGAQSCATPSYRSIAEHAQTWLSNMDQQQGGFKGAPKFPQIPFWRHILSAGVYLKDKQLVNMTYLTASKLCQGGIYDHIGGGWMRYSTDEMWLVPHFEKMLYDNAQFISWLSELAAYRPDPLFYQRIHETIEWLTREMLTDIGAFAASLDADSEGEEGKYYTWDAAEIDDLLQQQAAEFKRNFDITEQGNWEGKNIPHLNHENAEPISTDAYTHLIKGLLETRQKRIPPARDDKVLTDWNGLVIAALAKASQVFNRPSWLQIARKTFQAICQHLYHDNILYHCYRAGDYQHIALLEDYTNMIAAALSLYCATADTIYLTQAQQWCQETQQHYWHKQTSCYTQCSTLAPKLIINPHPAQDGALPAGNGTMAINLVTLWYITNDKKYHQHAINLLNTFSQQLQSKAGALYSGRHNQV